MCAGARHPLRVSRRNVERPSPCIMGTDATERLNETAPEVDEHENAESMKENLELSARNMSATNAAGGTFGLGLDQFELPKASIAKIARTDVRIPMEAYEDPRVHAIA